MSKPEQKEFINTILLTQDTYKAKSKGVLASIAKNDKEMVTFVINLASAILPNKKKYDPMVFLNMLRLIKEGMDQLNEEFLLKVQSSLLSTYADLGKFRIKDSDDTRGRFFFADKPDKNLEIVGNSCLRLILECILMWPSLFPVDSKKNPTKFKGIYENLLRSGVNFPKEVNYFKKKPNKNGAAGTGSQLQSSQNQANLPLSQAQKPPINMPVSGNNALKAIEEKLDENRNHKELLLNILSVKNESEIDNENLTYIQDYFKQFLKQTEGFLNLILAEGNQEKLLDNIITDQEFATDLIADSKSFKAKTLKLNDFRAKYTAIILKENQTATPNQQPEIVESHPEKQQQPHEDDIGAAKNKQSEFQNKILKDEEINKPSHQSPRLPSHQSPRLPSNRIDDDSPVLENNDSFHGEINKYSHRNEEIHNQKPKSPLISEENLRMSNRNKPKSPLISEENLKKPHQSKVKSPRLDEEEYLHENVPKSGKLHEKNVVEREYIHENIPKSGKLHEEINKQHDIYEDKPKNFNNNSRRSSQNSIKNLRNQEKLEKNIESHVGYHSEYIEKPQNPYNFKSVMPNKKEVSPNKTHSFNKLFENEENYKIEAKKPIISNILPRNEEKLSQIMNAKDMDRFSETSEKQQKSENFDYIEFKKENQTLKEENVELKNKLANYMNSYQETEQVLDMLKKENHLLQQKQDDVGINQQYREEVHEQEHLIEKLQQNNEALRLENQALNEYIQQQQHENEIIKKNVDNKGMVSYTDNKDFETLEMLKKENEALRNLIMEYKLKENEQKEVHRPDLETVNRLRQEKEQSKGHSEIRKIKEYEAYNQPPSIRGSALSRENLDYEEPRIQQNMQGTSSFKTKFMTGNAVAANNIVTVAPKVNKNIHNVKNSNMFPEEETKEAAFENHYNEMQKYPKGSVSPHKKIFEKAPMNDNSIENLKKSVEVGSEKKKRSNEASQNQSMEESAGGHQRLSNYLKRSGKFSRNESQKSAHTDQNNKSFEQENERILPTGFSQSQGKSPMVIVKSSSPYEGPRNFEENFDTNSVLNNSVMSLAQANPKYEESPYQSDLIYPFQKPLDYYQGKKANKSVKGFLIQMEQNSIFDEIDKNLKENSFRYKISCLRNKSLLFDNGLIQTGLISGIFPYNDKNLLKITLYFGNLSKYEISDFRVLYSGSSAISLWTKPEVLSGDITPKIQAKQDLLIDFNSVPYPFIMARCSYTFQGTPTKFTLPIPMTLNKFLQPKQTDSSSFKYKWKAFSTNIYKSETIDLNPRIAKSVYDFKKYLTNLIDLTPHKEYDYVSGVEDYKLCGCFEIGNGNLEILLKIITQPNKKALFQVNCKVSEMAEFLIRTLVFIFRK